MGHGGRHYPNSLKKHRRRCGYSQKKVAKVLDVTVSQVSRWEKGRAYPGLFQLLKLTILYRAFPGELYEDLFLVLKGEIEQYFLIADEENGEE